MAIVNRGSDAHELTNSKGAKLREKEERNGTNSHAVRSEALCRYVSCSLRSTCCNCISVRYSNAMSLQCPNGKSDNGFALDVFAKRK